MKPKTVAILTAAFVGTAACVGDEKYHIEQRQFEPEPQLSRAEWISALSGTHATLNYSSNWITTTK